VTNEIIFAVEESPEGGYEALSLGFSIYNGGRDIYGFATDGPRRCELPFWRREYSPNDPPSSPAIRSL